MADQRHPRPSGDTNPYASPQSALERLTTPGGAAQSHLLVIVGLIVAAALARLIPHPYNFTPIGAMALFAGAQIRDWRLALVVPLAAMALSDVFIGPDGVFVTALVYGCFAATVVMGMLIRSRISVLSVAAMSMLSAVMFYVVTNFGAWVAYEAFYEKTLAGLIACYTAGIPFFGGTLAGHLFYALVLFGGYALAQRALPVRRTHAVAEARR